MVDTFPPLPPGYSLEGDQSSQASVPPPPPGYQLADPREAEVKVGMPSLTTDLLHGAAQPFLGLAGMAARAAPEISGPVSKLNDAIRQWYEQGKVGGAAGNIAQMAGNVAATAPLAYAMPGAGAAGLGTRMLSGAASGAASGALQPVDVNAPDFWKQTGQNALVGGAGGAVAPAVLSGAARLLQPNAVGRVAPLMEAGVRPTPGQILGGVSGSIEERLSSVPGAGDFIRMGRRRAVDQFNEGTINQVLAPIGETLENGVTGREAIVQMGDKIRDAYNAAVPAAGGVMDQQALQDLTNLRQMSQFMPKQTANQFDRIMRGMVLDKVAPNGGMTGQSFKEAESDLGQIVRDHLYNPGASSAERQLGGAVRELQSTLRQWLTRVNPQASADISAANNAYAQMLRVENAATRGNTLEPGQFTPSQLLAGVKKYSTQRQFAQGGGLMQDYAGTAKDVLGDKYPDSGTPGRYFMGLLGAGLLGHGVAPEAAALPLTGLAAAGIGAGAMYSRPGQALLAHILATRHPAFGTAAEGLRNLSPAASAAVSPLLFGSLTP